MNLLNHIGDALLTKLVPGIDAKANCGQCRYGYAWCKICSWNAPYEFYFDDCDYVCREGCNYNRYCA